MIIIVSGMPGSGKSTVAKYLAKKLKLRHASAGDAMRIIAKSRGYQMEGPGFMKFHKILFKDSSIDKEIDSWERTQTFGK